MARMKKISFSFCGMIAGALLLACGGKTYGQTASATSSSATAAKSPGKLTCTVRTGSLSPGEIAFAQHDLPKAESLLAEETKAPGVDGDRAHNQLIRVLLRDEKFDTAEKQAKDWTAAQPSSAWAEISLAEVQWREGLVGEAYQSIIAAGKLDPCNPRVAMVLGDLYAFSGLNATAARLFDQAHRVDPVDDDIAGDWMRLQPRTVKLQSVKSYLERATFLTPDDRKSLEQWRDQLSAPPTPDRCHLVSSVTSTKIPYAAMQDGPMAPTFWGLQVSFNGKPRRLEIDTGAHGLLLTKSAANALHLDIEDHEKARGIGDDGDVNSHISRVKSIKIGSLEFQDCAVEILEKNPQGMQAEDGLIGGDVFSDFLLTLDFPGRQLRLDPLPAVPTATAGDNALSLATGAETGDRPIRDRYIDPSMKDWAKVFRSGHDLIIPVSLNNGPSRLFIMDTGSQLNLVSWQMAKQFAKVSKGSEIDLVGISGKVKQTYTTGPITLTFANLKYPSNGLIGMDTSSLGRETGVAIAGFLGAPTLHQLTVQIDYRDNLVHFTYDPKRLTRCVDGINIPDCF